MNDPLVDTILERMCPSHIDADEDQKFRLALLTKETGRWIFHAEKYTTWLKTPGSFLWLHGQGELFEDVHMLKRFSWCRKNYFNVYL
jgi:hypothetical protein